MSEASSSPKRPRLDYEDSNSKDEQYEKFRIRDVDEASSLSHSKSRKRAEPDEDEGKDEDGKSKVMNREATPREHTLVMRLTNKEQELQECMNQIQEMKQAQTQKTAHLRSMLLDPAINLVFQRMAKEMDEHKEKLKQKQNELSAWKFTPDSQTGMRLMAKCRMLLQENGDLGKMISSGRTARLEGEIALHKALVTEMKKNQKELDEFVGELEEDVEGMQGMIFMLQEQLKEAREQIARLQQENEQLRTLRMPPDPEPGGEGQESSDRQWAPSQTTDPHSTQLDSLGSPCVPPALTVLSRTTTTSSDHHNLTHSSDEDLLGCGPFVSKVTPDSGVQTQEEEEVSMDTSDCAKSPGDVATPLVQSPVTSTDRTSSLISTSKLSDTSTAPTTDSSAARTCTSPNLAEKSSCDVVDSQSPSLSVADNSGVSSPTESNSLLVTPQACDVVWTPTICPSNGQDHESNVSEGKRTFDSGRTNHLMEDSTENCTLSDAGLSERTGFETEDRKQSVQSSVDMEEGKELTNCPAQQNLVNGSANL